MSNFSDDMRNEIKDMKKKVKKINDEKQSLAYEMVVEQRKQNKRLFVIIVILCFILAGLMCYTIWLLNDITVVETSEEYNQDIKDNGDINNTNIVNGGSINGNN